MYVYIIYTYIYNIHMYNMIESLQSARLVEHNIIGEMKSQFFIGMLLWVSCHCIHPSDIHIYIYIYIYTYTLKFTKKCHSDFSILRVEIPGLGSVCI